ncbi:GTPase Era [Piscinibacterium candidicorallinum]|uniref:GTPase Era n=1 Tax=Piscinibacterium candidicorallinum TaxID=1793872 RepID=A0ABV7GZV3_9BURK
MSTDASAVASHRAGLVAIVGRPNVGKSTLLNALIGERLSITSRRPQTTRHRILGVLSRSGYQIGFVDTPGFQTRHGGAMPKLMNRSVTQAITGVEAALFVSESGELSPADLKVLDILPKTLPVLAVINKIDLMTSKDELLPVIARFSSVREFAAIVPVSAEKRLGLDALEQAIAALLPESEPLFEEDTLTDRSERFLATERVREKVFRLTGDEVPFGTTVVIETWEDTPRGKRIAAAIVVSRESHKPIIIGHKGERIKRIGQEARLDLAKLFDCPVHLELWVKVREGWAESEASLRSLGFD